MDITNEFSKPMCAYHKRDLVLYSGVLVCEKCLTKNYGIRLSRPVAAAG